MLRGVAAALLPGGRTFFSMGGRGTAAVVYRVLDEMKREERWGAFLGDAVSPHFFRGPEEYDGWLRDAGLEPRRVELVRKPMRHANAAALEGWLRTTWVAFRTPFPRIGARSSSASCSIACAPAATAAMARRS